MVDSIRPSTVPSRENDSKFCISYYPLWAWHQLLSLIIFFFLSLQVQGCGMGWGIEWKTRRSLSNFVMVFDERADNPSCNGSSYVPKKRSFLCDSKTDQPTNQQTKATGLFLRPVSLVLSFSWLEAPGLWFGWLDNGPSSEINSGMQR